MIRYLSLFLFITTFCTGQNIGQNEIEKIVCAKLSYDGQTAYNISGVSQVISD